MPARGEWLACGSRSRGVVAPFRGSRSRGPELPAADHAAFPRLALPSLALSASSPPVLAGCSGVRLAPHPVADDPLWGAPALVALVRSRERRACRLPPAACRLPRAACRVPPVACRLSRAACRCVPRSRSADWRRTAGCPQRGLCERPGTRAQRGWAEQRSARSEERGARTREGYPAVLRGTDNRAPQTEHRKPSTANRAPKTLNNPPNLPIHQKGHFTGWSPRRHPGHRTTCT